MYPAEETLLVDREDARSALGSNGRGTRFFFEQGHFAKEVIGPEGAQIQFPTLCVCYDLDFALLNHVHAATRLALTDDDFPISILFTKAGHLFCLALWARCCC